MIKDYFWSTFTSYLERQSSTSQGVLLFLRTSNVTGAKNIAFGIRALYRENEFYLQMKI